MKLLILLFLSVSVVLSSCSGDNGYTYQYDEPTIYSPSDEVVFSEIIIFLKPFVIDGSQKKYVVVDSLRNIVIKINNKTWTTPNSYGLDTAHVSNKTTVNDYLVTTESITYPTLVNVVSYPENFETAGQYADLLNNYFNLNPGTYICQLQSFDIMDISGNTTTIYTPSLSFPLEIKPEQKSVNIGEFEVLINN
ncbi:MAG: hypothetical protein LBQ28_03500 [Prevotellaceae bacterium]|jgi:hypothetical protein|nr:hypothetical protein [Prevotellaceae bacterium]